MRTRERTRAVTTAEESSRGGRVRPARAAALLLAALLLPAPAAADPLSRGIDTVSFKLAPGDAFGAVESPLVMPAGQYRVDLAVDGALGLMALRSGEEKVGDLLSSRLDLHLLVATGLPGGVELGVDLPVTAHQAHQFSRLEESGFGLPAPAARGAGDIRITSKVAIPLPASVSGGSGERGLFAAFLAELRLPTGDEDSFMGEADLLIAPRALLGWEAADWRVAAAAGYRWRAQPGRFLNLYVGDELHAALAAARTLPPIPWLSGWDVFGEVSGATPARAPFASGEPAYTSPLEVLGGIRLALPRGLESRLMAGTGLSRESGLGRPGLRLAATIGYAWPTRPAQRPPARAHPHPFAVSGTADCPAHCIPVLCPPDEPPMPPPVEPIPGVLEGPPWAVLTDDGVELRGAVRFELGEATLSEESLPVLGDVRALLQAHPEIRRVRIDGHTDSLGSADFNLTLSRLRAQSVVDYLVSEGIDAGRVSAEGFGQEKPIDSNETAEGRARNRRVEVTIIERD